MQVVSQDGMISTTSSDFVMEHGLHGYYIRVVTGGIKLLLGTYAYKDRAFSVMEELVRNSAKGEKKLYFMPKDR